MNTEISTNNVSNQQDGPAFISPQEAQEIIRLLVGGFDPVTGEYQLDGPLSHPSVKYSLIVALDCIASVSESLSKSKKPKQVKGQTLLTTLELFQQGLRPEAIAEQRELQVSTIYGHLEKLVVRGDLDLNELASLELQEDVKKAYREAGSPLDPRDVREYMQLEVNSKTLGVLLRIFGLKLGLGEPVAQEERNFIKSEILRALEEANGDYSRYIFAKVLQGAPSTSRKSLGCYPFAALAGYDRDALLEVIDELLELGELRVHSQKLWLNKAESRPLDQDLAV